MKSKELLFLIISVIILSSCSAKTDDKLNDKKDSENIAEEKLSKSNTEITVEQIINEIKIESEIKEDVELSDIKKIQDTYYAVVKVNTAELSDQYYMLWKYDGLAAELLLKGKIIEILTSDNYYFVNYCESFSGSNNYRIVKYDHNDENYEKVIYQGDSLKFSFSPNSEYMCIQDNNEIIILDKNHEILFKNKLYNNAENADDGFHPVEIKFIGWKKDNKKLWVATGWSPHVMAFHLIDIENSNIDTFYSGESYNLIDIALNPDNNCIVYSTYPGFYESGAYDEFMNNETKIYLYLLNIITGEKIEISTSVTKKFEPEWVSDKIIEYNDPDGFTRLTFNIDGY